LAVANRLQNGGSYTVRVPVGSRSEVPIGSTGRPPPILPACEIDGWVAQP
jgi:hypothetical protein